MAAVKDNKITASPQSDLKVRVYGDTVIETLVLNTPAGPTRQTGVWVKQNGTWKVVSVHQALIAKK